MDKRSERDTNSASIKERKLKEKRKKPTTSKSGMKAEFESILNKCLVIYNYEDQTKDFLKKREKMIALHKLLEWIIESDRKFIDHIFRPNLDKVWDMITQNIVRPLPNKKAMEFDPTEGDGMEEDTQDKNWPTLELVYEILLHLIKHPSVSENHLKYFLTESFIQEILDLFETENCQERDYLKQVTHKLYAKVVKRRKLFRKMFNNHFLSLIYERPAAKGANEILDIYSAIISGFAVPLRPEHVEFFKVFLTPLLKMQTCSSFYEELLR
jgi:serine/threonine-protein phosphatase 2A regulatory subunit B'